MHFGVDLSSKTSFERNPNTFESRSKLHFRVDLSAKSFSNPIRKRIFACTFSQNNLGLGLATFSSLGLLVNLMFESKPTTNFGMDLLKKEPWALARELSFRLDLSSN